MSYEFLSHEWFAAVETLPPPPAPPSARAAPVNLLITRPGAEAIEISVQQGVVRRGFAPRSPTTVTTSFDVARSLFVEGDRLAAMRAFLAGEVDVEGDVAELMALGTTRPTAEQVRYLRSMLELTSV